MKCSPPIKKGSLFCQVLALFWTLATAFFCVVKHKDYWGKNDGKEGFVFGNACTMQSEEGVRAHNLVFWSVALEVGATWWSHL